MKRLVKIIISLDIFIIIMILFLNCSIFNNIHLNIISKFSKKNELLYTFFDNNLVNNYFDNDNYIPISSEFSYGDKNNVIENIANNQYDSIYDEIILSRDEGNEDYKYMKVKVGKYDAHLVAIYNPEDIKLLTCRKFNTKDYSGRETVTKMAKREGAIVSINAGGFVDYGKGSDIPKGYVIKDNKVIWAGSKKRDNLIAFDNDNRLRLIKATGKEAVENGIRDAVEFGPFLMINGERTSFTNNSNSFVRAARTAIAQRRDGIVLFLVTEGVHYNGPTLQEVYNTLSLYGAYNMANLDGGGSTQLVINNKLINKPRNTSGSLVNGGAGRNVVTAFALVKEKKD